MLNSKNLDKMNNIFDINRFCRFAANDFAKRGKVYIVGSLILMGVIFLISFGLMSPNVDDLRRFSENSSFWRPITSAYFFLMLSSLWIFVSVGSAFPSFRSKEKTIDYIMIPASTFEKFTYEFLIRVVGTLVVLVFGFYGMSHLAGALASVTNPASATYFPTLSEIVAPDMGTMINDMISKAGDGSTNPFPEGFLSLMNNSTNLICRLSYIGLYFAAASFFRRLPLLKIILCSMGISFISSIISIVVMFTNNISPGSSDPTQIMSVSSSIASVAILVTAVLSIVGFFYTYYRIKTIKP